MNQIELSCLSSIYSFLGVGRGFIPLSLLPADSQQCCGYMLSLVFHIVVELLIGYIRGTISGTEDGTRRGQGQGCAEDGQTCLSLSSEVHVVSRFLCKDGHYQYATYEITALTSQETGFKK